MAKTASKRVRKAWKKRSKSVRKAAERWTPVLAPIATAMGAAFAAGMTPAAERLVDKLKAALGVDEPSTRPGDGRKKKDEKRQRHDDDRRFERSNHVDDS